MNLELEILNLEFYYLFFIFHILIFKDVSVRN